MAKPTIIFATSNGIGMGHLARATAIALELKDLANPVIVSVAGGIAELPAATGIRCEYIPGENRGWMKRNLWDSYLQSRLLAVAEETNATVITFDGVVPYPGFLATKISNPHLKLIWIRRGLWQKNALRFALPLQSKLVDQIFEPGDIARTSDHGPTSKRTDAQLTSPVSLFHTNRAKTREEARSILGLDLNKPAILVQLGTGDDDMNEKMRAALSGLIDWQDLQIVLTKHPVDQKGNSLVPVGLNVKVVRYFPLADLLFAFDAAIAATGYNSVHELLPAQVPTVFISNIRGTDDQDARAQWCQDYGYALRADHSDLKNITETVEKLISINLRTSLHEKCAELQNTEGGAQIARALLHHATQSQITRIGMRQRIFRRIAVGSLRQGTFLYRRIKPKEYKSDVNGEVALFSDEVDATFLRNAIKGNRRFEQIIPGASKEYLDKRKSIASRVYL